MHCTKLKKAAAVLLSAAMVFSVPGFGNFQSFAAKKPVRLNVSNLTLKEGQGGYRLYLKNNNLGWKIKKVAVSNKDIVSAYGKTAKAVKLKGKNTGNASVKVYLALKQKKNQIKKLTCKVKVVPAKNVKLNTKSKTLTEGQKGYRLYLKNNSLGWKIKKVAVSNKNVVSVYGKTAEAVKIKAKKAGSASVTLRLKSKQKKSQTKKLTCKVKVVAAISEVPDKPTDPDVEAAPDKPSETKSMTVTNQSELDAALTNPALESLSIQTMDMVNLKIQSGSYPNIALSVNAPNAEIENNAVFKSIAIYAIRENTWIEKAIGNKVDVYAVKARIVVDKGSRVEWVDLHEKGAEIEMEINGAVSSVAVSATMKIKFEGNPTVSVPIIIGANAGSTELTASIPVSVTTNVDANIILNKGAEESKIKINLKSLLVKVTNNTGKYIETTNADNVKQMVPNTGKETTISQTGNTSSSGGNYSGGGGSSGGGSSGGSSSGSTVTHTLPTFSIKASVRVDTTTTGALLINKNDIKIQGCTNPVIKVQHGGNIVEQHSDFEEENGIYIYKSPVLGSNAVDETIDRGVGTCVLLTVQDQGTEYVKVVLMNFGEMLKAGNVQTFEGVMMKKTDITVSFDAQVISGAAISGAPRPDHGWMRLIVPYDTVTYKGGIAPKIEGARSQDNETFMNFQLIAQNAENRWVSEKNGEETYTEMLQKVKRNVQTDREFLYLTFLLTDNGKKYEAYVSTSYRDFFGDDPDDLVNRKCHYTIVLYETE